MSDNKLIKWINRELLARGISQRDLGKLAGISHAYVSDVLREAKPITWNFCLAISKALNEPVWNLFIMAGLINDVPQSLHDDEEIRMLIKMFSQLPPPEKSDVMKYLQWIKLKGEG